MTRKQMRHGALGIILALALVFSMIFWSGDVMAIPTFQTYIPGADADSMGQDLDTWFITATSFDLSVVTSYAALNDSAANITLLISFPEGQSGQISINDNPVSSTIYTTLSFLPADLTLNPLHYPLADDVSDFQIYDLGTFANTVSSLNDYDASTGIIAPVSAPGEEKQFSVSFTGFSSLHFDVYGLYFSDIQESSSWVINPDSHDATALASAAAVPEPATLLLLGAGLGSLGLFGRRRFKDLKA